MKKRTLQMESLEDRTLLSATYLSSDYTGTFDGAEDRYSVAVTQDDSAFSVRLSTTEGTDVTLSLYDANDTVLAYGTSTEDFWHVLNNVTLTKGTYSVGVHGAAMDHTDGTYQLTVMSGASLETESDTQTVLRDTLDGTGIGVGTVAGNVNAITEITQQLEGNVQSIAMDGNRFAVVTVEDSTATLWLYDYNGSSWDRTNRLSFKKFTGIDPATFGQMLDISGDYIMMSSGRTVEMYSWNGVGFETIPISQVNLTPEAIYLEGNIAVVSNKGDVLVYRVSQQGWQQVQALSSERETFGSAIAYDAATDRLYVGDSGERSVTVYDCETWASTKISNATPQFGWSLAAEGQTLVVGAEDWAMVYDYDGTTWHLSAELSGIEVASAAGDFGVSVAICENQILVSAQNVYNGTKNTGAVYLFQRVNDTWTYGQEIFPKSATVENMKFGNKIFLQGSKLFVLAAATNTMYAISGYADSDTWTLNVTQADIAVTYDVQFQKPTSQTRMNVDVYAPDGSLVAHEETAGGSFSFTPSTVGVYRFVLSSANEGNCSYVLEITGGSYAVEPFLVTATVPQTGKNKALSTTVEMTFSDQVLAASLKDAVASINGQTMALQEILDGHRVVWTIPASLEVLQDTLYTVEVTGIQNLQGNRLEGSDSFSYRFTYSDIPKVTSYTVASVAGESLEIASYRFSKPVQLSGSMPVTLKNGSDVTIPVQCTLDTTQTQLTVTTDKLLASSESYVLSLDGTAISDAEGNTLLADLTDVIAAGMKFQNLLETGIQQATTTGTISNTASQVQYAVSVKAGQSMNLRLTDTLDDSLLLEVYDGSTLVARGSALEVLGDGNGQRVTNLCPTSTTSYTICISGDSRLSSTVNYELTVTLGAMEEWESNNDPATATDLSSIGAAVGKLETGIDTSNFFSSATQISLVGLDERQLTYLTNSASTNCVVSGDWAVIMSDYFLLFYKNVNGTWTYKQTIQWVQNEGTDNEVIVADMLSIALDGETLVAGHVNRAEVYTLSASEQWTLEATLRSDETISYDGFGYSVAIDGDTIAVSAPYLELNDGTYNNAGKIYMYQRSGGAWVLSQTLEASDRAWVVGFGSSVVLEGDTLVTLSTADYYYDETGAIRNTGAIYIWKYDGTQWNETSRKSISELDTPVSLSGLVSGAFLRMDQGQVALTLPDLGMILTADLTAEVVTWEKAFYISELTFDTSNHIYDVAFRDGEIWCSYVYMATDEESGEDYYAYSLARLLRSESGWTQSEDSWTFSSQHIFVTYAGNSLLSLSAYEGFCVNTINDVDYYSFVAKSTNTQITIRFDDPAGTIKRLTAADLTSSGELTVGETYTFAVTYDTTGASTKEYLYTVQVSDSAKNWAVDSCTLHPDHNAVTVRFQANVNLSTIAAGYSQLKLASSTTTVACTGYEIVDGQTIRFTFGDPVEDGVWTFGLAKNLFSDLAGSRNVASSYLFTVDSTAPVISTSANGSTFKSTGDVALTILFNESIAESSFVGKDISLVGAQGGKKAISSYTLAADGRSMVVYCGRLNADSYTLTLDTMNAFRDLAGNAVGTSAFHVNFQVTLAFASISDGVKVASLSDTLATGTTVHRYTFTVGANEMFSVVAAGSGAYTLQVYESGRPTSAVSETALTDTSAWIPSIYNASNVEKTYVLEISGVAGEYDVRISRGAVFGSGSTLETAVDLSQSTSAAGHVSSLFAATLADETVRNALYGVSVATDGTHVFVGVSQGNTGIGEKSGYVAVYEFNGLDWIRTATLTASDTIAFDSFGSNVIVMEAGRVAVTSVNHYNASTGTVGCIYIFEYNETTRSWNQSANRVISPSTNDADFGSVVDYANGRFVIGTQSGGGTPYIFEYLESMQSWNYVNLKDIVRTYLFGVDYDIETNGDPMGSLFPYLGYSVSVDGNTAVVTAPMSTYYDQNDPDNTYYGGVVFVLEYSLGWNILFPTFSEDQTSEEIAGQFANVGDVYFGFSTDVCGDTLVASALRTEDNVNYNVVIYTFHKTSGIWTKTETPYVLTDGLDRIGLYENLLNLEDESTLCLAGATGKNGVIKLVYSDGSWQEVAQYDSPSSLNLSFGASFEQTDGVYVVGDPEAFSHTTLTGSAYTYATQKNFYRVVSTEKTITVTTSQTSGLKVQLLNQDGAVVVEPSQAGGVWTFSNLTAGREYFLAVSAASEGTQYDYSMMVNGIQVELSDTFVTAQATSKKVVWTFEVPISLADGKMWSDVVSIYSSGAPSENRASQGTFTLDTSGMLLTWTANLDSPLSSDETLTTTVDLADLQLPISLQSRETLTLTDIAIVAAYDLAVELVVTDEYSTVLSWVDEWHNVQVEIRANLEAGDTLQSFSAVLNYDPALFIPVGADDSGSMAFSFTNLNITATKDGSVLLGTLSLKAQGGVRVASKKMEIPSSAIGLYLTDMTGTHAHGVVEGTEVTDAATLPKVYPVSFDLDDSGVVNLNDIIELAKNFGLSASESISAFNCDFDGNGSVILNDLILLVKNYQTEVGDTILFDSGYPLFAQALTLDGVGQLETVGLLEASAEEAALTQSELDTFSTQVLERASSQYADVLASSLSKEITFQLTDLQGNVLATQIGNVIWIDWTAAGCGWYADQTPWNDTDDMLDDSGRVDLLTVILHELGHAAGLEHAADGWMEATLSTGVRRLPDVMDEIFG